MERFFNIIMNDLTSEQMKLEEELEFVINSKNDIHTKVNTVKDLLNKLIINEASMVKFASMIPNNKTENTQENGTI
jgi:prophage DNA circulation protein